MTPQLIFAVAAGGALGSSARYLVGIGSGKLFGTDFPLGTLIINVTGSFLMGLFVGLFAVKWDLSQAARAFLTVGICGGYTTFSTFSLDAYRKSHRARRGRGIIRLHGGIGGVVGWRPYCRAAAGAGIRRMCFRRRSTSEASET